MVAHHNGLTNFSSTRIKIANRSAFTPIKNLWKDLATSGAFLLLSLSVSTCCRANPDGVSIGNWSASSNAYATLVDDPGTGGTDSQSGTGITNTQTSATFTNDDIGESGTVSASVDIWTGPEEPSPPVYPNPPYTWYNYRFELNTTMPKGVDGAIYGATVNATMNFTVTQPTGLWLTGSYQKSYVLFGYVELTGGGLSVSFPSGSLYYNLSPGQYQLVVSDNKPNVGVYNADTYDVSGYLAVLPEPALIASGLMSLFLVGPRRKFPR